MRSMRDRARAMGATGRGLLGAMLLFGAMGSWAGVGHAAVLDSFDTETNETLANLGGSITEIQIADPSVPAGQRDLRLECPAGVEVSLDLVAGIGELIMSYFVGDGTAIITIEYDGDNDALQALDPSGLGSLDLTSGGSTDAFGLTFPYLQTDPVPGFPDPGLDPPATGSGDLLIGVEVGQGSSRKALAHRLVGSLSEEAVVIPFDELVDVGAEPVDLTDVGYVRIFLQGRWSGSSELESVETTSAALALIERSVLVSVADTTIYETSPGNSNGAGVSLYAGSDGDLGAMRGLIAFDPQGTIPAGALAQQAVVELYVSGEGVGALDETVSLHRTLSTWGEAGSDPEDETIGAPAETGDATWLRRFYDETSWTTPGGDFDPVASASVVVGAGFSGSKRWESGALAADVTAQLALPMPKLSWFVLGNEGGDAAFKFFVSRENSFPAPPRLTVEWLPPNAISLPVWDFEWPDASGSCSASGAPPAVGNVTYEDGTGFAGQVIRATEGSCFAYLRNGPGPTGAGSSGADRSGDGGDELDVAILALPFTTEPGGPGTVFFDLDVLAEEVAGKHDPFEVRLDGNTVLSGAIAGANGSFPGFHDAAGSAVTGPYGSSYDDGRRGWRSYAFQLPPGTAHTLEFFVGDEGDTSADTALLVDNVRLVAGPGLPIPALPWWGLALLVPALVAGARLASARVSRSRHRPVRASA